MKRLLLTPFFFLILSISNSQNLVPNYSFENIIKCINDGGEFNGYVSNWLGQGGGGELWYFTSNCQPDSIAGVPYNHASCPLGFQYAHTGVSYVGIVTFVNTGTDTTFPYKGNGYSNFRNYIEAKLIDSLKGGTVYYIAFFISLANYCTYACSDVGAFLSDSLISLDSTSYAYAKTYLKPQIANDPLKFKLTDTLNWMKISGSYKAHGGEKYIIIGNFKNDTISNISYTGRNPLCQSEAYYYIDDVILSPDSAYADSVEGVQELKVENEKVKVFPNPSNGLFNFQITNTELEIKNRVEVYNILEEKIFTTPLRQAQGDNTIDLSNQPKGLYLYRVLSDKGTLISQGKLIIQ